jgi:hypothetical protein
MEIRALTGGTLNFVQRPAFPRYRVAIFCLSANLMHLHDLLIGVSSRNVDVSRLFCSALGSYFEC